jgi:dihydroflavonol-4-reductase
MTVVVTGAAGHIGAAVVRALLARGRPVRAMVHRDQRALEGLNIETVQGDVRDEPSLRRAFHGAEVVYHVAGYVSILMNEWPQLEAVNVLGTRNVVEACLGCGVRRLVHFSSIHALEQTPLDVPVDEARPLVDSQRGAPYNRSKAEAEKEVRKGVERELDAVIVNPTAVVGPYDYRMSHMGRVLLAFARGALPALITGGYDWVDVRDVAEGAVLAEERGARGSRYLLSGHWVSVPDLAAAVGAVTGARVPRLVFPLGVAKLGVPFAAAFGRLDGSRPLFTRLALDALGGNRRISHARATEELGYTPRPFQETLRDTFRWFQEAGYLSQSLILRSPDIL